jgi:hypothetical protein
MPDTDTVTMPGESLMEITVYHPGRSIQVRCPGCHGVQIFPNDCEQAATLIFLHGDGCPVGRQVELAFNAYRQVTEVRA